MADRRGYDTQHAVVLDPDAPSKQYYLDLSEQNRVQARSHWRIAKDHEALCDKWLAKADYYWFMAQRTPREPRKDHRGHGRVDYGSTVAPGDQARQQRHADRNKRRKHRNRYRREHRQQQGYEQGGQAQYYGNYQRDQHADYDQPQHGDSYRHANQQTYRQGHYQSYQPQYQQHSYQQSYQRQYRQESPEVQIKEEDDRRFPPRTDWW